MKMLDSLTFLFEKFFLFSNLNVVESQWQEEPVRCPALRRGDLLQVQRTLFIHYGICLGENRVAHLMPDIMPVLTNNKQLIKPVVTNKRLILGCIYRNASIRVDSVEDFAYGAQILVNDMDMKVKCLALASEEVARRAEQLVGDIPYSLLWNNCEHFVTYCRYGTAVSQQTEKFCDCLKSIIRDQRSVALTVGIGVMYSLCFGLALSTTLPTILIPFILWMAG
ncbi:lecithin retinol acyltransferase-like [Sinocyclocheilus rhinocerous]|uniref:Lecithin retinol acyltransferase-like n=1 Tax=Sinocyclocheilus rhinocerous TaxID=307959 RepID=A0A673HJL3_9TELE|nr:PREDICTED: lecithin retinol acyltransferase-like [Sinocyclocheilus rhinocerous]